MAIRIRALFWISVSIIIVFSGFYLWWRYWINDPKRVIEQSLGLEFPSGTHLLFEDEQWDDFLGNGHRLWVLQFPVGFGEQLMEDCKSLGLKFSELPPKRIQIVRIAQDYIRDDEPSCSTMNETISSFDFLILNDDKLLMYTSIR